MNIKAIKWFNICGRGDIVLIKNPKEKIIAGQRIVIDDILCEVCSIEMGTIKKEEIVLQVRKLKSEDL